MFYGTNIILWNIPHVQIEYEEYSTKLIVRQNISLFSMNVRNIL